MPQKLPRDLLMIFKNRTNSADGNFWGGFVFVTPQKSGVVSGLPPDF